MALSPPHAAALQYAPRVVVTPSNYCRGYFITVMSLLLGIVV